jgi:hypothetical protein
VPDLRHQDAPGRQLLRLRGLRRHQRLQLIRRSTRPATTGRRANTLKVPVRRSVGTGKSAMHVTADRAHNQRQVARTTGGRSATDLVLAAVTLLRER